MKKFKPNQLPLYFFADEVGSCITVDLEFEHEDEGLCLIEVSFLDLLVKLTHYSKYFYRVAVYKNGIEINESLFLIYFGVKHTFTFYSNHVNIKRDTGTDYDFRY